MEVRTLRAQTVLNACPSHLDLYYFNLAMLGSVFTFGPYFLPTKSLLSCHQQIQIY